MNRARVRIPAILLAVLLATTGCGAKPAASAKPSASAAPSTSASPAGTSTASAGTPTAAGSPSPTPSALPIGSVVGGWVVGIPGYIPKFSYGQIDRSQCGITVGAMNTLFTLCFRSVTKSDLVAYETALRAAKFSTASEEIDGAYTLTACLNGDWENATLILTLNEADGTAVYSLGVPV